MVRNRTAKSRASKHVTAVTSGDSETQIRRFLPTRVVGYANRAQFRRGQDVSSSIGSGTVDVPGVGLSCAEK